MYHVSSYNSSKKSIENKACIVVLSILIVCMVGAVGYNFIRTGLTDDSIGVGFVMILPIVFTGFMLYAHTFINHRAVSRSKPISIYLCDMNKFKGIESYPSDYMVYYADKDGVILCKCDEEGQMDDFWESEYTYKKVQEMYKK